MENYDYSTPGSYFITICVKRREPILSEIIGQAAPCLPYIQLSEIGKSVEKYILSVNTTYENVTIDKYIIMPDHIHMIITITDDKIDAQRAARPTIYDIVRSIKIMVRKEIGFSPFQESFHDHIIRNEHDYREVWQYIENNPINKIYE